MNVSCEVLYQLWSLGWNAHLTSASSSWDLAKLSILTLVTTATYVTIFDRRFNSCLTMRNTAVTLRSTAFSHLAATLNYRQYRKAVTLRSSATDCVLMMSAIEQTYRRSHSLL